ncbi:hypothetical protein AAFF_G00274880 [Aldrovandia affinis]|uniref:Uncharacterized protein n=1 Tax=Aldrovandia affinis TaxID=143900 RepID=A0AAD7STR8_9TELE|nr:hypothetical protein AAFF_G00274880 [Aldrovandia affinis]
MERRKEKRAGAPALATGDPGVASPRAHVISSSVSFDKPPAVHLAEASGRRLRINSELRDGLRRRWFGCGNPDKADPPVMLSLPLSSITGGPQCC